VNVGHEWPARGWVPERRKRGQKGQERGAHGGDRKRQHWEHAADCNAGMGKSQAERLVERICEDEIRGNEGPWAAAEPPTGGAGHATDRTEEQQRGQPEATNAVKEAEHRMRAPTEGTVTVAWERRAVWRGAESAARRERKTSLGT